MVKRAAIPLTCGVIITLLLSGCSYVTPTVTEDEATEKVEEHAQNTLSALPENTELELMHDHWDTNGYQILNDNRPGDPFINARTKKTTSS